MLGTDLTKRVLRSRVGPNGQSIVGAAVGLIAVFQPWLMRKVSSSYVPGFPGSPGSLSIYWFGDMEFNLLDLIARDTLGLGFFCAVFLFGTLLSAFSPVGAVPQMIGLLGFAFGYAAIFGLHNPVYTGFASWSLGLGYALGIVSTLIVLQSPGRAMLTANGGRPVRMLGRFAALSPGAISSWK